MMPIIRLDWIGLTNKRTMSRPAMIHLERDPFINLVEL